MQRPFRLHAPDIAAILLLAGVAAVLVLYPRTAVIEDFWYHLALGHWIAEHGRLFLHDPVSFQPFGRPQLYPLLMHTVTALGEWIVRPFGGGPWEGSVLVRIALYIGNLGAVWWVARRLASPIAALLALVLVATDQAVFYSAWSLMPASWVGTALVLLVLAVESRRIAAGAAVLAATFYAHIGFPWLTALGVALVAWTRPARRRSTLRMLAWGGIPALPFLGFLLWHRDAFFVEKAVNANPIPGIGPFGYASHYHLSAVLLAAAVLGIFLQLLPRARIAAVTLALSAALVPVLVGRKELSAQLGLHPMTLLNVGSVLALATFLAFLVLGLRVVLPRRGPGVDAALGALAGGLAVPLGAMAFHVEMTAGSLWDGLALAALLAACGALAWVALRRRVEGWPLGPMTAGAALLLTLPLVRLLNHALGPEQAVRLAPETWAAAAAFLCAAVALTMLTYALLRARPLPDTFRLPLSVHAGISLLLGLLPTLPFYGGRYFWHTAPLLAVLAVVQLRPALPARLARVPMPVRALVLLPVIALVAVPWPLFTYSRNFRQDLAPQPVPVRMALAAKSPTEHEEPAFQELVAWVLANAPEGTIIKTDDPRTAHMLTVFTERPADNGMFWEAQTQELQDLVAAARAAGEGIYVYVGSLPTGVHQERTIGKWKVANVGL